MNDLPSGCAKVTLILNGDFSSGTSYWSFTRTNCPYTIVHPEDGNPSNSIAILAYCQSNTDNLYQTITIPADAQTATLSYRFQVSTSYVGPSATDFMTVSIRNSSGQVLATLATYSNLYNPKNTWQASSFNLAAYAGQTIRVHFNASNGSDPSLTHFWLDDVSVLVTH